MDLQELSQDIKTFHQLAGDFWKTVPDSAWNIRTGQREKDWTLHECLAHLLAIAIVFNKAVDAALRHETLVMRNFNQREDLAAWNESEIARLRQVPPNGLIVQLLHEWQAAGEKAAQLNESSAQAESFLPVYQRSAAAKNIIEWQLSHAGVIHAAQVTRPLGLPPLWTRYETGFKQRLVGRFLRHLSMAYWHELGADEPKTLNFIVEGESGGAWHIVANKQGAQAFDGLAEKADYSLHYANANTLFGIFSLETSMLDAFAAGQVRVEGEVGAVMNLIRLFSASRPKG